MTLCNNVLIKKMSKFQNNRENNTLILDFSTLALLTFLLDSYLL